MNSFSVRTKIMMGGGLETIAPKLHKVFIVTDGFMASSGKVSYITDVLDKVGAEYRIFDQVKADPDIATVTRGVDTILEFKPDAVIAFGGGSPSTRPRPSSFLPPRPATCGTACSSPCPPPAAPAPR